MAQAVRTIEGIELPPAGTYTIDPAHSSVEFVVRHLLSKARGRFTEFSGEIVVGDGPEDSSANVEIVAASVNTNQEMRDNHLKSGDFFLTEEHPTITFRSNAVRPTGGNAFELDGDLTIRGITKPVTLAGRVRGDGREHAGRPGARVLREDRRSTARRGTSRGTRPSRPAA